MWRGCLLASTVALLLAGDPPVTQEQEVRYILCNVTVYKGESKHGRHADAVKVAEQPRMAVSRGQQCAVCLGSIPELFPKDPESGGSKSPTPEFFLQCKPGAVKEGMIYLDIVTEQNAVSRNTDEQAVVHTQKSHTVGWFKLGEPFKVRWGQGTDKDQTWAEVTVNEHVIKSAVFSPARQRQ